MNTFKLYGRAICLLLAVLVISAPLPAQKPRARSSRPAKRMRTTAASSRKPAASSPTRATPSTINDDASPAQKRAASPAASPTAKPNAAQASGNRAETVEGDFNFDTLLSADTYALYGEVRMVGQQMQEAGLVDLLRPLWLLSDAPKELKQVADFLDAHAEALTSSRLLFVGMPSDSTRPQGLFALELPSEEVARRFAPELQTFLTSVVPPKAVIDDEDEPNAPGRTRHAPPPRHRTRQARLSAERKPPALPFHIQRAGSLVVVSDTKFKLQSLRPDPDRLLSNQPNFKLARTRFAGESLFIYFDFNLMERTMKQMREAAMEQQKQQAGAGMTETTSTAMAAADPAAIPSTMPDPGVIEDDTQIALEEAAPPILTGELSAVDSPRRTSPNELSPEELRAMEAENHNSGEEAAGAMAADYMAGMFLPVLFGGGGLGSQWPEAISIAANMEGDALAVRALLLDAPETKSGIVPFFPLLISGPPLAPEASSFMPSGTDIFVSASLDLPQIYERVTNAFSQREKEIEASAPPPPPPPIEGESAPAPPQAQPSPEGNEGMLKGRIAAMEKLFGFKINEDLIGSLGNEVAFSVPASMLMGRSGSSQSSAPARSNDLVVLISLKDKEKMQRILPRVLLAFGLQRASETAQNSKIKGVEMMSFGQGAFAFVGNFLAYAPSAASLKRVVESYTDGQTLASTEDFRASTRWQPRQTLGQVYVSHALIKSIFADAKSAAEQATDAESRSLLPQLSLEPGSVTHAVTNEGDGALHEVRLPRNLLTMFVAFERIDTKQAPIRNNESRAMDALIHLKEMEILYKQSKGKGNYATLEQLVADKQVPEFFIDNPGYKIELSINGDKFEVTATPLAYPEKGRRSFFIDESGILRGADKGGRRADASDAPIK